MREEVLLFVLFLFCSGLLFIRSRRIRGQAILSHVLQEGAVAERCLVEVVQVDHIRLGLNREPVEVDLAVMLDETLVGVETQAAKDSG